MFSDPAPCQRPRRRLFRTGLWRFDGILCLSHPKYSGNRQLAFPGSMVGAFLGAYLFQKTGRFLLAYLGEVVGTGIIGGTLCYPVAVLLMGKDVALFFYVLPFLMSTACGTAIAFLLIEFMRRIGLFSYLKRLLDAQ